MISYYKNSKGDLFLTDDVCTCAYTQEANYDSAGDLTKVRVVRVCSCAGHKESGDKVLSRKSFNEWVPTKTITCICSMICLSVATTFRTICWYVSVCYLWIVFTFFENTYFLNLSYWHSA